MHIHASGETTPLCAESSISFSDSLLSPLSVGWPGVSVVSVVSGVYTTLRI